MKNAYAEKQIWQAIKNMVKFRHDADLFAFWKNAYLGFKGKLEV